ncbi:hypothetical protein [Kitasatospora sp. NRRL B-11411]|uniref:hypothetical protein n=1 Tax=Kitasatospora sp. NRRL B-11411 TaxID=1463822 RepID=UPI000690CAC6|nr:hypothetical protein [Kitasatospora sp. NRRL B-11411]
MREASPVRYVLDLGGHRNNAGCAAPGFDARQGFDGFGRTYPAEELAALGPLVGGWPELLGRGDPDNAECDGQVVELDEPLLVHAVGLLGASCGGALRDELVLAGPHAPDGVLLPFGFPDFLARPGTGDEVCEFTASALRENGRTVPGPPPRLWRSHAGPARPVVCSTVRLPVNPGLHLFGLWVLAEAAGTGAGRP